jgi:hypothetical protein
MVNKVNFLWMWMGTFPDEEYIIWYYLIYFRDIVAMKHAHKKVPIMVSAIAATWYRW